MAQQQTFQFMSACTSTHAKHLANIAAEVAALKGLLSVGTEPVVGTVGEGRMSEWDLDEKMMSAPVSFTRIAAGPNARVRVGRARTESFRGHGHDA
jgi:hypothetical protein